MASSLRAARVAVEKICKAAGVQLVSLAMGGKHLRATVRSSNGAEFYSAIPVSPSDSRWSLNKISELRNRARIEGERLPCR